jgi:uncharacterized BrkB/YihY/UPF0761 family membrane protein
MNPAERAIRAVDHTQRRFTPTAFVFGVIKKYGDDNGGVLVSNLAYSAFVSLFPLLLILVTALGLVAAVNPAFRADVLKTVAKQVPAIGSQLTGNVHELKRHSVVGLIVGIAGLIWGSTGPACSRCRRSGTCPGRPGPDSCRGSDVRCCSSACSARA